MNTLKDSKPAMAEVLIRHVLGESESFERVCAKRGLNLADAVSQALRGWMAGDLSLVTGVRRPPLQLLLPDPSDCPQGQEAEWIETCKHDLNVLYREQERCIQETDAEGWGRVNRSIDAYIQAVSELKERVA